MQLKAFIKKKAEEKHISTQLIILSMFSPQNMKQETFTPTYTKR
jgi:hypothetical protein